MRVIITGGTGLIGSALIALLRQRQFEIVVLSRDPAAALRQFAHAGWTDVQVFGWNARTAKPWGRMITTDCAIVNLAGASPAHWRWTNAYQADILASRLHAGEAIVQAIARYGSPAVLVQASASGYYGDRGDEVLTEASAPGQGFRAEVCQQWEASTAQVQTRRCVVRTGIVLDNHAGAFPVYRRFARMMGSQLGTGHQWMPWIHRDDVAKALLFLIEQPLLVGPFNVCAPEPVSQSDFTHAAQRILRRPALFPMSALALRAALGEMARVVLDSQRIAPQSLLASGFTFTFPHLEQALQFVLRE